MGGGNGYFYETDWRGYDPQLGRFKAVDALASLFSGVTPYNFSLNNPIKYNDPTGLAPNDDDDDTGPKSYGQKISGATRVTNVYKAEQTCYACGDEFERNTEGNTTEIGYRNTTIPGFGAGNLQGLKRFGGGKKNDKKKEEVESETDMLYPGINGIPVDLRHSGRDAMISSGMVRNDGVTVHGGIDIHFNDCGCYEGVKASTGGNIYSTVTGLVVELDDGNNAINIINADESIMISFMHMSKLNVKTGDIVEVGDIIGEMGNVGKSNGAHLHYQIQIKSKGKTARNMDEIYGKDWLTINPLKGISVKSTILLKQVLSALRVPAQGLKTMGQLSVIKPDDEE